MVLPVLKLDSREQWKPVPVEESLAAYGYEWIDYAWHKDGKEVDRIDFPPDMKPADFIAMSVIGYHRVARGGGLHWHQFWTWWPYNPKVYAGKGAHEGDWEMVQFGCTDKEGTNPVLATYSAHSWQQRACYWDVELTEGKRGDPVVYVARTRTPTTSRPSAPSPTRPMAMASSLTSNGLSSASGHSGPDSGATQRTAPASLPTGRHGKHHTHITANLTKEQATCH
jgi:hypothetical protein